MEFTIIFRTFGPDLPKILGLLNKFTDLKFDNIGQFKTGKLYLNTTQTLENPNEILDSINPYAHGGWRVGSEYWQSTKETYETGKIYPIRRRSNPNVLTLFFDDNVLKRKIIGVNCIPKVNTEQSELQQELIVTARVYKHFGSQS